MSDTPRGRQEDGTGARPEQFGGYRVEQPIGAGGMGKVYRALDEALNRQVALKTLLPALSADPEFVARFKREAQSAAALNHPNITQIYAIGQEGAVPFFAMELIRGHSLESLVKERGALDPVEASRFIVQAAQGLRHAAQKGVIHRDIKPSNLMLTEDGVVKITDFGLAKAARSESQLTVTGEVLGSPGYISPEQAQGGAIDLRSDIYSLGATFYHLVTGRMPFEAATPLAMIMKHLNEPVRSPRALNPAIPYPLGAAIQKMMAKRPDERFRDYDALIGELERATVTARVGGVPAGAPGARGPGADPASRPARARSPRPDAAPDPQRRSFPWLPALLLIILGGLVAAGVRQRLADAAAGTTAPGAAGPSIPASGTGEQNDAGPAPDRGRPAPARFGLGSRLRERIAPHGRADLRLVNNDHEFLPTGGLRVVGTVKNAGGTVATQARVRVRILLASGQVSAEQEAPLHPDILGPGETATFEVLLDHKGAVGTIRAELHWTD